jgi:preprotein translocase subunit Sec63
VAQLRAQQALQGDGDGATRRQLRALRVRFHPDKAPAGKHELYEALSKLVNAASD